MYLPIAPFATNLHLNPRTTLHVTKPNNSSLRHAVFGAIAALVLLLLGSGGWWYLSNHIKSVVAQKISGTSQRLKIPMSYTKLRLTPLALRIEGLTIGNHDEVLISKLDATVHLNPFAGKFLELSTVSLDRISIRQEPKDVGTTPLSSVTLAEQSLPEAAAQKLKIIDKAFAALPFDEFTIRGGHVRLMNQDGSPRIEAKGLRFFLDKAKKRVVFRVDTILKDAAIIDRFIQGRFEAQDDEYLYFVRRKKSLTSATNLWAISGSLDGDISEARVLTEINSIPAWISPILPEIIAKQPNYSMRIDLSLHRQDLNFEFDGSVQSLGSKIKVPLISRSELGPIRFDMDIHGSYKHKTKNLLVDSFTVTLPHRKTAVYGETPFTITGRSNINFSDELSRSSLSAEVTLPHISCQTVLDAVPEGVLPEIEDFKLAGDVSGKIIIQKAAIQDERLSYRVIDEKVNCSIKSSPEKYSANTLLGPLTITPKTQGPYGRPAMTMGPLSPNFTPLDSIAGIVTHAFVSAEDAGFFQHRGIDPSAIESALKRNLVEQRVAVGGSTITMQLVKNLFLSQDRTLARKAQELFLAWHLEQILSKERILELYLNIVEFGPGIYGITDAAKHFFDKHPDQLNLVESAYLALLLPSPKLRYQYFCSGSLTPNFKGMLHGLIRRMHRLSRISGDTYNQYAYAPITFNETGRINAKPTCDRIAEAVRSKKAQSKL